MIMDKKILNKTLQKAKNQSKNEFITSLSDVEDEMRNYKKHFKDKVILCNCDDPHVSAFFTFFSFKFEDFKIKKLITTCFKNQNLDLFSKNDNEKAIYLEYNGDLNQNKIPDREEIDVKLLKGDGDFRSEECINFLKKSDIVVTNPPFSLFKEYIAQLIKFDKKFIIMGNHNALTYKEVYPLIHDNKIWLGVNCGTKKFEVPDNYDEKNIKIINGKRISTMGNVVWYTNLDIRRKREKLLLHKNFNPKDYPEYDNFEAIHIEKLNDIPMDYDKPMGVPITFLFRDYEDAFELLGNVGSYGEDGYSLKSQIFLNGKKKFKRLLVKRKLK